MNPKTTLGVLTDTHLVLLGMVGEKRTLQSIPITPQLSDLGPLIQQAVLAGLTSVWVMPGTTFSHAVSYDLLERGDGVWEVVVNASRLDPSRPAGACVWRKVDAGRQGPLLLLTFPAYGGWDWQLPDAPTLLATVTYLEHALGVSVNGSPAQLARDLLTGGTVATDAGWTGAPTVDLPTLSTADGQALPILESAQQLVWMRPLTLAEWHMRYLHKYEHHVLDLEACTEAQLGAGDPLYSMNGRAYNGKLAGIWRVSAETAGSIFDGKRLPSCLHGEWMSTPEVKCCIDLAYQVHISEGYYWPESHRTLEHWATTLWKARERLQAASMTYRHARARANASHTTLALAQLGIGTLVDDQAPPGWYRPDWWAQIIGQSRANLLRRLVRMVRRGSMPVLVDRGALWVVSNDPHPLTAVPGLHSPEQPARYTAAYETPLPLTGEIKEAFRTTSSAEQLARLLDDLARQEDKAVP
jgi:hypothetical protein